MLGGCSLLVTHASFLTCGAVLPQAHAGDVATAGAALDIVCGADPNATPDVATIAAALVARLELSAATVASAQAENGTGGLPGGAMRETAVLGLRRAEALLLQRQEALGWRELAAVSFYPPQVWTRLTVWFCLHSRPAFADKVCCIF